MTHAGGAPAPRLEGRLLRVVGRPEADGPVRDAETGLAFEAATVRRWVQRWMVLDLRAETGRAPIARWEDLRLRREEASDIPQALVTATLVAPGLRIAGVPLSPAMAERLSFGLGEAAGDETLAALAARFPGRKVSREEGRFVLAAAEGERREGDIRIDYRLHSATQTVTMIGVLRGGQLMPPPPGGFTALQPGDVPARDMLVRQHAEALGEARFYGRIFGFGLLAIGVMTVWLWSSARAARAEGRADPNEDLYKYDAGSGYLTSLVAVPFLIATAPIGLGLMIAAWACTQGWQALLGAVAGLVVLALLTLWATAEED